MLALDLLCVPFSNRVKPRSDMTFIRPPAIAIELPNAKRFQQRFQLQKGFVFGVCPPIRQYHPSYDQLPTPTSVVDVWIARNSTSRLFRLPPRHCLPGRVELLFGSVPTLLTRFHSPPSEDSLSYNNTSETLPYLPSLFIRDPKATVASQFPKGISAPPQKFSIPENKKLL